MAYDPGAIDSVLAAAVGDDAALIAELRASFIESALRSVATVQAASTPAEWAAAAHRLTGLAASFGAVRLMALASDAAQAQPGNKAMIAKLNRAIARL
ncbi:MAG: Hpt domain-containing protein [Sphingomonas sp.]